MGRRLARKAQRRGANCAVSGGYTALNRITDVMRVASPRITQRLCAIGPPRGQAVRKATSNAACGRDGVGPPAGGPATQQAQAPAAARSSSRASARPRRSVPGFPRRRSCGARPLSLAGLRVAQRPRRCRRSMAPATPGPGLAGPARRARRLGSPASSAAGGPRCRPAPACCNAGRPPSRAPAPAHPAQRRGGLAPAACGVVAQITPLTRGC